MSTSLWVTPCVVAAIILLASHSTAQTCRDGEGNDPKDRILFRNGDVLTGRVGSVTREAVGFHNSAIGELLVQWNVIAIVEVNDRIAVTLSSEGSEGIVTAFQKAEISQAEQGVILKLDTHESVTLFKEASFHDTSCLQNTRRQESPNTEKALAKTGPRWVFNINAPLSVAFGSTSQETLGGLWTLDFYEGKSNHSKVAAGGAHNRTWQTGQPSVTTDTFDGFFQESHSFGARAGGVYGKVEMFLNSSLGMAREASLGAGYFSSPRRLGPVQFNWLADLRYFNERLYGSGGNLGLVGSRFEGQFTYRKMDSVDTSKVKYLLISKTWINPMWNNENALRMFTTLQLSVPFKRTLCLSFAPIENDYMRNAPVGKKPNYFTSSVTLKVEHGSDPNQRCY